MATMQVEPTSEVTNKSDGVDEGLVEGQQIQPEVSALDPLTDCVVRYSGPDLQPQLAQVTDPLGHAGLKQGPQSDSKNVKADENTKQNFDQTVMKKKKRVIFPEDGNIVSGYMDPPSPWNDAAACSTEDLVQAYRKACEKHGVKPLGKLLQQLPAISDFCDRNETLTLKGERLDYKHCETLEEILRRVQFRTIDLESTNLEDEGAVAVCDMIEHYESCTRLNISANRSIGVRGWQACGRLLKKTPCLEILEIRNCSVTEQAMQFFCRPLRLGSMLTTLHLENSIMSGRPLIILVAALKMNDILRDLYLADNRLMPSDGIQLGNLLRYNFRLQLLDIRNNHLQDVGLCHISDGVWEQNLGQGLATLVVWNNQITYQSMTSLGRALINTRSMETLNLGHNNISNEGIHRLKEGLMQNKSLLRIGLQASKVSCEGSVALAEFIAESPRLMRIDLRENDIKTGGLMALSLSLKVSETVTRIDLDKEPKRESSMRDYAEQQRRLLNDINNYTQRNRDLARQREEEEAQRQETPQPEALPGGQGGDTPAGPGGQAEDPSPLPPTPGSAGSTPGAGPEEQPMEVTDPAAAGEGGDVPVATRPEDGQGQEGWGMGGEDGVSPMNGTEEGSPKRPLVLLLPGTSGSQTLDSPAFSTATARMPYIPPETPPGGAGACAGSSESRAQIIPMDFPPSPMVSDRGHTILAPVLDLPALALSPTNLLPSGSASVASGGRSSARSDLMSSSQEIIRPSPSSSPTAKRKFVISRVVEAGHRHAAPVVDGKAPGEARRMPEDEHMNPLYSYYNSIRVVGGGGQDQPLAGGGGGGGGGGQDQPLAGGDLDPTVIAVASPLPFNQQPAPSHPQTPSPQVSLDSPHSPDNLASLAVALWPDSSAGTDVGVGAASAVDGRLGESRGMDTEQTGSDSSACDNEAALGNMSLKGNTKENSQPDAAHVGRESGLNACSREDSSGEASVPGEPAGVSPSSPAAMEGQTTWVSGDLWDVHDIGGSNAEETTAKSVERQSPTSDKVTDQDVLETEDHLSKPQEITTPEITGSESHTAYSTASESNICTGSVEQARVRDATGSASDLDSGIESVHGAISLEGEPDSVPQSESKETSLSTSDWDAASPCDPAHIPQHVTDTDSKMVTTDLALGPCNGVKLDIADVLDNLDKVDLMGLDLDMVTSGSQDNPVPRNTDSPTSPDDFEKELDAMLAN